MVQQQYKKPTKRIFTLNSYITVVYYKRSTALWHLALSQLCKIDLPTHLLAALSSPHATTVFSYLFSCVAAHNQIDSYLWNTLKLGFTLRGILQSDITVRPSL